MQKNLQHQTLTVGELCYAIAEGKLPATLQDNQWYQVNGRELRRFANRQQRAARPAAHILRPIKA
jgi:hypothetical protein